MNSINFNKITGDYIKSLYSENAYEAEIEAAFNLAYRSACDNIKVEKTKFNKSASDGTVKFMYDHKMIGWYIQECKRKDTPTTRIAQFLQAMMYVGSSLYDVNVYYPGNRFMGCFLNSRDLFIYIPAKNIDIESFEPLWRKYVNQVSPSNAHNIPELFTWAYKYFKPESCYKLDKNFRLDYVLQHALDDGIKQILKNENNIG